MGHVEAAVQTLRRTLKEKVNQLTDCPHPGPQHSDTASAVSAQLPPSHCLSQRAQARCCPLRATERRVCYFFQLQTTASAPLEFRLEQEVS